MDLLARNPLFMGKIKAYGEHPAQIVDGMHSSIISPDLFYRVQEVLAGRRSKNAVGKIIDQIKVESVFKDLYKDVVNDFLTNNGHSRKSQQKSINKKVEVLKTRIANLENKYADNEISTIDFNKMNGRFSNELKSLESQSESEEKYRVVIHRSRSSLSLCILYPEPELSRTGY